MARTIVSFTERTVLQILNRNFEYVTDKEQYWFPEVWRLVKEEKVRGDCEDYSLALLYRLAGKSTLRSAWWLLVRRAKITHYKHAERGTGHAALWYRSDVGGWVTADNISGKWNRGEVLERHGYKKRFSWPFTGVLVKMAISAPFILFS